MTLQLDPRSKRHAVQGCLGAALVLICATTLFPLPGQEAVGGFCVFCGELGGVDFVLNVLLFLPLGVGIGLTSVPTSKGIAICAAATVMIEALQFAAVAGRDASAGDALANSLGGATGILIVRTWPYIAAPEPRIRRLLIAISSGFWLSVLALTAFSLNPHPTGPPFYGQLARQRSVEPPYPGSVRRVHLAAIPIPDAEVPNGAGIPSALRAGASFSADVTPEEVPRGFAPIARVADNDDVENVMIGAMADVAVFSVRTSASALRARPYVIGLAGGLTSLRERVTIVGQFHRATGRLVVSRGTSIQRATVTFGLGSGWRLLLPFPSIAMGSTKESLIDVGWLILLLAPTAYWTWNKRAQGSVRAESCLAACSVIAVVVVDGIFQLPVVPRDIAGVLSGITCGSLARRGLASVTEPIHAEFFARQ
jgi:hypothetical protein